MPPSTESAGQRAMHKLLSTPELLELILLQLDMRTLLVTAQRVSRDWRAFIVASPALQKHLFFTPDTSNIDNASGTRGPVRNPLLAQLFPAWFASLRGGPLPGMAAFGQQPFAENPRRLAAFMMSSASDGAGTRQDASWRRMLVQQRPPVRHIGKWRTDRVWTGEVDVVAELYACCDAAAGNWHEGADDDNGDNNGGGGWLRMGLLYDILQQHAAVRDQRVELCWATTVTTANDGGDGEYDHDAQRFCETTDLPGQSPTHSATPAEVQERRDVQARITAHRRWMASRAGLIVMVSNSHGWCGTTSERAFREGLAFDQTFFYKGDIRRRPWQIKEEGGVEKEEPEYWLHKVDERNESWVDNDDDL